MEVSDRERSILARLSTSRFATVQELSALLDVSEVTVRRYLEKLEQDGMLTRTRGGAFVNESMLEESSFGSRRDRYIEEKRRIAVGAAAMIDDGDTIALSAGTTTYEIARCLKERRNLTVVTNSISIASELATCPGIRLLVTGGTCRERSLALVGALAERSLVGLYVNQTFLGTSGFSLEHGLTTPNFEEALVNAAMVRAARRTVVALDSSKFGQVSLSLIVPVAAVHSVITDTGAPAEVLDALRAMPKEVITV